MMAEVVGYQLMTEWTMLKRHRKAGEFNSGQFRWYNSIPDLSGLTWKTQLSKRIHKGVSGVRTLQKFWPGVVYAEVYAHATDPGNLSWGTDSPAYRRSKRRSWMDREGRVQEK